MTLSPPRVATGLAVIAALAIGVDLVLTGAVSGAAALAGMLVLLVLAGRPLFVRQPHRSALAHLRGVFRFEVLLVAGLAGFVLARGFILASQVQGKVAPGAVAAARTYDAVFACLAAVTWIVVVQEERLARWLLRQAHRPALLLTASFAALIVAGALLLALPISVHRVADISIVDSLFTSTSAVCVTGLAVNDVGATYTPFGQAVILLLIQLGGIGIMTIAALAAATAREGGLAEQSRYAQMLETRTLAELRRLVRSIVVSTAVIEIAGTLLLWMAWQGDDRLGGRPALWCALFHAVSAFCNAGFSLFSSNFMMFTGSAFVQVVICLLIVLGGIGFPVIMDVWRRGREQGQRLAGAHVVPRPLALGSRVALVMSLLLIVAGAGLFAAFESTGTLSTLPAVDRPVNALFQSVTTRTAGFNTLDFAAMHASTLLIVIVLMFIGGSPGSCAGGIKTTTAAVLGATLKAELRGHEPELGRRAIAPEVLRRAVAVTTISMGIVVVTTLALTIFESKPFLHLLFEATSAYGTVGLSMGVTPTLTVAGKLVIVFAMFAGRVGPLTIALAVGRDAARRPYRLARESLPIG